MNKFLMLPALFILASCSNYGQLTFMAKLPRKLNENSGLAILDTTSVWFIEDGGNADKIHQVSLRGDLLKELEIKNAKNQDWEDLASDPEGNVYIGDLGNNFHKREEVIIYKIPNPGLEPGNNITAQQIKLRYPGNRRHDSEAMFYREGFLYLITKDRARPFTGEALIYKVPASEGFYEAELVGNFTPCRERGVCEVTAADISPDGKKVALLGYGTLWIFSDFVSDDFTQGKLRTINLGATTQLESVGFPDTETLLLSDEKLGATGRNLYKYKLD